MRPFRVKHTTAKIEPAPPTPEMIAQCAEAFWVAFGTLTMVQEDLILPRLDQANERHVEKIKAGIRASLICYLVRCGATLEQLDDA